MKKEQLKKILIKEGVLASALLVVLMVVAFFTNDMVSSVDKEKKISESKILSLDIEMRNLQTDYRQAGASLDLFARVSQELSSNRFSISRDKIRNVLLKLKNKYRLSSLNLTVTPQIEYQQDGSEDSKLKVLYSVVNIEFGGFSDRHIYNFIEDLKEEIGGISHFTEFYIDRQKSFNPDIYVQVSQGVEAEMVRGKLTFSWYGIEKAADKTEEGAAAEAS